MILRYITHILTLGLALIITALLVPGVSLDSPGSAFIAAVILGLVNAFIKPILHIVTLPIQFVTLGLFTLLINGLILTLVAHLVSGFNIHGFGSATIGALVLSIVSLFLSKLFH